MLAFQINTEGTNRLALKELCQRFVDEAWIPAHLSKEQAEEFVLDCFKRTVEGELELLEVEGR